MSASFCRGFLVLLATVILVACGSQATAQLIYQETFEDDGDGSRYELFDRGHEDTNLPDQASGWGIWGHNFDAKPEEIGLASTAPDKRAAFAWVHEDPVLLEDFGDAVTDDAVKLWLSLVDWAVDSKPNATVGFFPSIFPSGTELVATKLEEAGYKIEELFTVEDVEDAVGNVDVLIHSSEQGSPSFTNTPLPIISYSQGDHDDIAVTQIGQSIDFFDAVELNIPEDAVGHPALGDLAGTVPFMTEGVQLRLPGAGHNGGTTLATVVYEDPISGDDVEGPALFVIEKGDPLLGAFNPDPEGDGYIIGAALNKFGDGGEKWLTLNPVDISGQDPVNLRVALAATAADFEPGDYLRIEVEVDGKDPEIIQEFWGVDSPQSDCHKGLSNGEIAGEVGDICLPTEVFEDFTFELPKGNEIVVRFAALTTWGNELIGIDNVRILGNDLPGDYNGDGALDAADLDRQAEEMAKDEPDLGIFDEDNDGAVDYKDRVVWAHDRKGIWIGDADMDGEFNSGDLVAVFTTGKYETGRDAGWIEGDWNGDGKFDSGDFVVSFADGGYEQGVFVAPAAIPEPSSATFVLLGLAMIAGRLRRRIS